MTIEDESPEPIKVWVDRKSWDGDWQTVQDVVSGGQASAKIVRDRTTCRMAFLKILNQQNDPERRARFFREATAYETANHPLIPRLIESNSHHHSNVEFRLFLITDFIEGPNLTQFIDSHGPLAVEEATTVVSHLLGVVDYYHSNQWIHRDVKPDNIILHASKLDAPFLIDFGLAYKDQVTTDFATEHGQELGNRFLRLPELSAGSSAKQDLRTDLSFVGGILFYLMTGMIPSVLIDAAGRMPHQRPEAFEVFKSNFGGPLPRLLGFFDKTFSPKLTERFLSAREMKSKLDSVIEAHRNHTESETEDDLKAILSALNNAADLQLAKHKALYDQAMTAIGRVHREIRHQVEPTYQIFQSGYVNFTEGLRNRLGFCHFATQEKRFAPEFFVRVLGDEIVVEVDGETVYRTGIDEADFGEQFQSLIRNIFLRGLRKILEAPTP